MTKLWLLGAGAMVAAAGLASPAAAQYSPYPYGGAGGGVVGAILNGVLGGGGYGRYGNQYGYANDRMAVDQCVRATEARLGTGAGYGGYGAYGGNYGGAYGGSYGGYGAPAYPGGGYGTPYYGAPSSVRVTGVERKNYGFHVRAVASSGNYGGYGGYGAYGAQAGGADLKVNCKVEANGRIRDLAVRWLANDRPYYGANYRRY